MEREFRFKDDGTAIAFLAALAVLYFLPVLAHGSQRVLSSVDGDTWSLFFYWRRFAYDSLARGELPLWNPYNFSGTPFVAAMQSAIFYPPNLLFFLFDTPFAINLSIALHVLCASVFTYLFARYVGLSRFGAALAGVTFAYSAPYFIHVYPGHLPHLAAMWMPLMFLGMEAFLRRKAIRYAVWAGVCLALHISAGYPQYPFYGAAAVSLYFLLQFLWRDKRDGLPRLLLGHAAFIAVGVLLSAVQLLPAWEFVRNSARGEVSYEWISIFSLPPENLLTMIVPNLFGDIVNVSYWGKNNLWEMSVYLGIVPLYMAAVALALDRRRQVKVFAAIAGLFLIVALGKHTPLLWLLYTFVPGFGFFRGVAKAAFVFAFAGSLIAGFGFDGISQLIEKADKKLSNIALLVAATAFLIAIVAFASSAGDPYAWRSLVRAYVAGEEHFDPLPLGEPFFEASRTTFWFDIGKLLVIAFSLAGCCLVARKRPLRAPTVMVFAILALGVVDLWHFGSRYLVSFDPRILSMDRELKAFFATDRRPFRIATPLAPLRNHLLNVGMLEGIENVGGYDAIVVKNHSEFINFTQGLPIDQPNLLMGINRISPLLNMLNVKYYLVGPTVHVDLPGLDMVFENKQNRVYRSLHALPRSFIVHDAQVVDSEGAALRVIGQPGFDPTVTAVVHEPVPALSHNAQQSGPTPVVREHAPTRVVLDAQTVEPGLLLMADTYYPGWKAFVDGREAKIYRANYVMRAVFLPAGRHRVEFHYEPISFRIGVFTSLIALILTAAFLLWSQGVGSRVPRS